MEKIWILDFGSQYTQLIARRVREQHIFCEIVPYNHDIELDPSIKGIILSGSPFSVNQENFLDLKKMDWMSKVPTLAVCYGAQLIAKKLGGKVEKSAKREYGRAKLEILNSDHPLFQNVQRNTDVWMSHGDTILTLPDDAVLLAKSGSIDNAAYEMPALQTYCLQFHPEVYHSTEGSTILQNFLVNICGCAGDWTEQSYIDTTVAEIKAAVGTDHVLMALSGGVDSTVTATLISKAIGDQLTCVFVDNGVLRKDEYQEVQEMYKALHLNVIPVDAKDQFYHALLGLSDPELKRKAIGKTFIDVFDQESKKISDVKWLGQGTIYPDVIESVSVLGPSVTIKSHHNVGGLPEKMHLKVLEPLRKLFKDEVRNVGKALGIDNSFLARHPFPGPGLAIRILGEITPERVQLLQEADYIYINTLKKYNLYHEVWQAGTILLDSKSVGVMGDERTYENVVALRAVTSTDGMTADWAHLPYEFLAEVSNAIINNVRGINRVVYDISSKPPATIEWE